MEHIQDYLKATVLCDFSTSPAIRDKASALARGMADDRRRFNALYGYVRELPYGLEDWNVRASETLARGWGMCSGKTNLLVALSRSLAIPARYRVFKIRAERRLLKQVMAQNSRVAGEFGDLPPAQDHVQCEAYLDGWQVFDPSRDPGFENGLRKLGIPLERTPLTDAEGAVHYQIMASIDEWAASRQEKRKIRQDREAVFAHINAELDRIRRLGSHP